MTYGKEHLPESVVINNFNAKPGAAERAAQVTEQLLIQLASFAREHFPATLCYVHRVGAKSLYLEKGVKFLFTVQSGTEPLLRRAGAQNL